MGIGAEERKQEVVVEGCAGRHVRPLPVATGGQ